MDPVPSPDTLEADNSRIRVAWLGAKSAEDLVPVEQELRRIVEATKKGTKSTADPKYRVVRDAARQRLCLLLIQNGRAAEADAILRKAGCVARLGDLVLAYDETPLPLIAPAQPQSRDDSSDAESVAPAQVSAPQVPGCPGIVCDGLLSDSVLRALDANFASQTAPYWTAHGYCVEPPTPYFSYAVPIDPVRQAGGLGALGCVVRAALRCLALHRGEEVAGRAKVAELWAHNRPHPSGHQFHFDSDDEGRGGVRNPIASCVTYLTTGVGGPTVITNQKLSDTELASDGWAALPHRGRLVMFNGNVLHGVVPGRGVGPATAVDGVSDPRRVTVMVALWEDLRVRDEPGFGSSRPLPSADAADAPEWVRLLTGPLPEGTAEAAADSPPTVIPPRHIAPVWTDLEGAGWARGRRMPPYEKAYQGF